MQVEDEAKPLNSKKLLQDWEKLKVVFILPNLHIKQALETKYVGLLSGKDKRIKHICNRDSGTQALVKRFSDQFGKRCSVGAMVIHDDAPNSLKSLESLVCLRNICAITHILHCWQLTVGNLNRFGTLYSDYFDLYPFGPTKDGKELLYLGPSLHTRKLPKAFRGQIHPNLEPMEASNMSVYPNKILLKFLLAQWTRRFEKSRKTWASNQLFRSLAIAYHASSLPQKNYNWFYDTGVNIALWVSAIETLAHPGKKSRSGLAHISQINFAS